MKTVRFFGVVLATILLCANFTSCSKSENGRKSALVGTWVREWISDVSESENYTETYVFTKKSTYTYHFVNNFGTDKKNYGTYSYEPPHLILYAEDGDIEEYIIAIEGDQMRMSDGWGYTKTFYR